MQDIPLQLTTDEINAVLRTLGQLPTSSGAWPLMVKIEQQASDFLKETNPDQNKE